jgi:hypothetical protein
MDKSKLTIQRPEGCPEWAEIGVMVMVRDRDDLPWQGPLQLEGMRSAKLTNYIYLANNTGYKQAKPYVKWQPEPGEWVAYAGGGTRIVIGQYGHLNGNMHGICDYGLVNNVFRLVDDDGNLIDLRCSVEELKERTEWL